MKARSVQLKAATKPTRRERTPSAAATSRVGAKRIRLPHAERKEQILNQAAQFFAEYGLTGQTRELAAACGISQRLLYRFFPNKAALLAEVYKHEILGAFDDAWFTQLADRSRPMTERLIDFYNGYLDHVMTRHWLRLFLYLSLAQGEMAPHYIAAIITRLLETIVDEAAAEQGLMVPTDPALKREIGWTLHGALSHLAIRRRIYQAANDYPERATVALTVRGFIAGLPAMLDGLADVSKAAHDTSIY